jgi:glycosyltransferase involved in cell wall biosynthesis
MISARRPSRSPHTVDIDKYHPPEDKSARDSELLLQVAWMTGGNSYRKCVGESIRAFALLAAERPSLRLVVAGERGSDYSGYAELTADLGISDRVSFPGRVTREEKIRLMQSCAVYLQPSRFEGFGLAGVEAMSCGAAMVTSDVGAVREVCGDAVLYADGTSPDDIARQTALLLDRPEERCRLGAAARRRVETLYAPGRRRQDLQKVLESVVRGSTAIEKREERARRGA